MVDCNIGGGGGGRHGVMRGWVGGQNARGS